jgi:hypothetical protein
VTAATHSVPSGVAFDIVLLLHVAAALVGLATVVVSGVMAGRVLAARGAAVPGPVAAYFTPGVNWAGRVLYAVPVLGVALLAMSHGAYTLADGWVDWGIGLWVAAAAAGEALLWPAERRVREGLAGGGPGSDRTRRDCRAICASAGLVAAVLVAAVVVMVAQP